MNYPTRMCQHKEHDNEKTTYLCQARNCNLLKKWCCIKCITQGIHQHDKIGLTHIKEWKEIITQKQQEFIQYEQQTFQLHFLQSQNYLLSQSLQQCKQLLKIIKQYYLFLEQQQSIIQNYKIQLQEIISDLSEEIFFYLDDERISQILNFNQNQFINNKKFLIKPIQDINQEINKLEKLVIDFKEQWSKTSKHSDFNLIKYQFKQIDQTNSDYNASQISKDEQLLAYGGDDYLLKLYDIKQRQIIRGIKVDFNIYSLQFTYDSSLIFVGCLKGYVFGYDILNDYKLIFKEQIHLNKVLDIRTILNKYLITFSSDRTIIKTGIKNKQQIFKLSHFENIFSMDHNTIADKILSGCEDKSIILWDCNKQNKIIIKQQSHPKPVRQIQFINNDQNFLSLDSNNNLFKWKIDLINNHLIIIQEFNDPSKIYNFYLINQDQNLILICKNQVKILDDQANIILVQDHLAGDFGIYQQINNIYFVLIDSHFTQTRQLDSGRYIQVRSKKRLMLAEESY